MHFTNEGSKKGSNDATFTEDKANKDKSDVNDESICDTTMLSSMRAFTSNRLCLSNQVSLVNEIK